MKLLMISTDRKIFEDGSAVQQRIIQYGLLVSELHIIIFNTNSKFKTQNSKQIQNLKKQIQNEDETNFAKQNSSLRSNIYGNQASLQIPNTNVFLYPTNSRNRWFYVFDAIRIGRLVLENWSLKLENSGNNDEIIVTCQDPFETGLVGWWLTRKNRAKLNLQIHTDFLSKYFIGESVLNKIRVGIAKFILPKADSIRVVSERIKSQLTANSLQLTAKITVLPIFVDIDKIKNTPAKFDLHQKYPQFDFIMLVASRLEREKDIQIVIKSFAEVIKKYPKTGLVIVGNGSEGKSLQLTANSLQLQKNLVFEGWSNDLISYYKTADLFLLSSNYEGFGMSLVEATVSGCPILTTDVGLVGDVLDSESSLICPVGDKDCFVFKMLFAIGNQNKLKELNQKAQLNVGQKLISDKQKYLEEYRKGWYNKTM